jgi:serine/threonine protein kinase/Tfp pilus assembly protein PilF
MARFERWLEVKRIFEETLEVAPEERAPFLDRVCGSDKELRREVDALLKAPPLPTSSLAELLGLPERHEEPDYVEGDRIDHFSIVRKVGKGGMGTVYDARDVRNNDRRVALKVLFFRAVRFSQDKRLAGLSHPAIVTFHDSGETAEGLPYFVFEFIEGEPITDFCERRNLGISERLSLFLEVCDAVAYAHQRYLIHCDLKPENILVTATGALKLLDFGIARQVGDKTALNDLSPITLPFASPEQVGSEETTILSDVYSLGVLLCVLLTGRLPYHRVRNVSDLRDAIIHEEPARPSDLVRLRPDSALDKEEIPPYCTPPLAKSAKQLAGRLRGDLDAIVLCALSKEPSKRYAFATELAEDIRRHLAIEPVKAHPPSRRYRAKKVLRRRAAPLTVIALVSIALLVMSILLFGQYRRALRGERQASAQAERTRQVNRFVVNLLRRTNPFDPSSSPDASVDELLDQSSRTTEASLANYPDLKASLLSVLGEIFAGRGNVPKSKSLLEDALALQRRGVPDQALAETLQRYSVVLTGQGRYRDSEAVLAEAKDVLRRLGRSGDPVLESRILLAQATNKMNLGEYNASQKFSEAALATLRRSPGNFPELAESLHDLGRILELKDRDAEAENLLRQALSYEKLTPEPKNPYVAITLNSLAGLRYTRGDYAGARTMYLQALEINRATLGENSKGYALTLHNIAALDSVQGHYQEALENFTQVVAILQKSLPPDHLDILTARDQLASTLIHLHDYEHAEKIFLDVLSSEKATLPKNHPAIAGSLNNLAYLYQDEGHLHEAQDFYQQALGAFENIVGRKSRPVATLLGNLGSIAQSLGDDRKAEADFKEALEIAQGVAGERSPDTVNALINLSSLYISTGNIQRARGLINEVIPLAVSMAGPTGRLTGSVYSLEARLLLAQGDFKGSISRAQQANAIFAVTLPPQDWRIAATNSVLGAALGMSGSTAKAEPLLLQSLKELRGIKGDESSQVHDATEMIRLFYKKLGRNREAEKYQRKNRGE